MGGVMRLRERLGARWSGTGSVLGPRLVLLAGGVLGVAAADWISLALYDTSPALGTTVQLILRCGGLGALVLAVLVPAPWRGGAPPPPPCWACSRSAS